MSYTVDESGVRRPPPPPPLKPPSRSNSSVTMNRAPASAPIQAPQNRIPSVLTRAHTTAALHQPLSQAPQQQSYQPGAPQLRSVYTDPQSQTGPAQPPQQNPWWSAQQEAPSSNAQRVQPTVAQQQSFGTYMQSAVYSRSDEGASQPASTTAPRPYVQDAPVAAAAAPAAAPLPRAAMERIQSMAALDRESLRPASGATTPRGAARFTGYASTQQQQQPISRGTGGFVSPSRADFRRATSPGMSWMNNAIPRFRYEPPPMIPSYADIDRLASTPAKERRGDDSVRQRVPAEDRWGVPVRRIPNRFNSIPSDPRESDFDTNEYDNGYATRRQGRDETPRGGHHRERSSSKYGSTAESDPYVERHQRNATRRHEEVNVVTTPRESHRPSRRSHQGYDEIPLASRNEGTPRRADDRASRSYNNPESYDERQLLREEEERRQRRRERKLQQQREALDADDYNRGTPVRERSTHRSRNHRREDIDNTVMSDEYRAVDERAERHMRRRAARMDEEMQSPESYVVGSSKLGQLVVDVEPIRRASSPSSSRRRGDESEEQYRARRRAEREQRRMIAR